MKQPKITVVGLGPGRFGLITLESWQVMQQAEHLANAPDLVFEKILERLYGA